MSAYQYYEFRKIDSSLSDEAIRGKYSRLSDLQRRIENAKLLEGFDSM